MTFYRILKAIALVTALLIFVGTVYGVLIRPYRTPPAAPRRPPFAETEADLDSVFSGIGRIRSVTAGADQAAVILSIAFPYNSKDKVFSEELASHIADFRVIAQDYFSALSLRELKLKDEEAIKGELLVRYNQVLRLGSIKALYFSDYLIIE